MKQFIADVLTGTALVPVSYDVRAGEWVLLERVRVYRPELFFDLPAGFRSDLASVPRAAWVAIAPHELGILPALVHDYLYRNGGRAGRWRWTRAEADALFYYMMLEEGVPDLKARAAYTAVRLWGHRSWSGSR